MSLWSSSDVARAVASRAGADWTIQRVVTDSRQLQPGDLFVALVGEHFDGHDFVPQAIELRAAGAIVGKDYAGGVAEEKLIRVEDTLLALQDLGRAARNRSPANVIGVTGSVGKTSCKQALQLICSAQADSYATTGNLNNHIGLPLMLANMPSDTDVAIFEMGMNHAGEIALLSQIAHPDVAIITAVEAAHLEFFNDVGEIADAKAEIAAGMSATGTLVIPADSPHADRLRIKAAEYGVGTIIGFGESEAAEVRLLEYQPSNGGSRLRIQAGPREVSLTVKAIGKHWAMMMTGVIAVVRAAGLDVNQAAATLAEFDAPAGRGAGRRVALRAGEVMVLDDSYNASPASMRAAFARLEEMRMAAGKGRALAALGDMRELGPDAAQLHRQLAVDLEQGKIDKLYAAGPMMKGLYDALPASRRGLWTEDAEALAQVIESELEADDILLVKGSRGSRMDKIVTALAARSTG